MIFAHTLQSVLSGAKTQTRRLWRDLDILFGEDQHGPGGRLGVYYCGPLKPRWRWIIGHSYAVQAERCSPARGGILIKAIRFEANPLEISEADARAEGFPSADAFRVAWKSLHHKNPMHPVWVIEFALISGDER